MSIRKGTLIIAGNGGSSGGGGGISVDDIDGTTITLNNANKLQSSGTIEKNAGFAKFDWVGTYSEWVSGRNNSTIDDSWICYIVDDDTTNTYNKERTLGEMVFSLIPIRDLSLHILDGSLLDGTGIYNQFYTYMQQLNANGYSQCFISESDWQTSVTTYGVCGKFVLDTVNQTIRLPKVTGFVEGTIDKNALGTLVEAGLPNITSNIQGGGACYQNRDGGALYTTDGGDANIGGTTWTNKRLYFDASKSNSIYGNSTTVQPQAIKGYYYMVLATSVNLDISADMDGLVNELSDVQEEINGADYVVEWQAPTSSNGYRWYRLYKSGWIEQGGILDSIASINYSVTFLKTMNDTNYTSLVTGGYNSSSDNGANYVNQRTTTGMTFITCNVAGYKISWEAKGFAAQS